MGSSDDLLLHQQPTHPGPLIQWYVVGAIVVGCMAFLMGVSACIYRCTISRKQQPGSASSSLTSAIRKGLKETSTLLQGRSVVPQAAPRISTTVLTADGQPLPPGTTGVASYSATAGVEELGCTKTGRDEGEGGEADDEDEDEDISTTPVSGGAREKTGSMIEMVTSVEMESELGAGSVRDKAATAVVAKQRRRKARSWKLGTLHFRLNYDAMRSALVVTVVKATDLPAPHDTSATTSIDPYVKLQLLPDKRHKVKTRVLRKTQNPVYDEIFTFYGIDVNQLPSTILHFVVLSFDRFSRDDIIGEVVYPIGDSTDYREADTTVARDISPRHIRLTGQGRGEMLVSLCYQPAACRLTVVVLKARNLPQMDITGLSDSYVKVYLLYNGQRIAKKKTHVKKRTLNPVFNESFVFDIPYTDGLHNISMEFLALDWDRVTKNEVIGQLKLGLDTPGPEARHWREVINNPRKQIAEWHKLKE